MREEICCSGVQLKATHGCCPAHNRYGTAFLKAEYWCCNDEIRARGEHVPSEHIGQPNPGCQEPRI